MASIYTAPIDENDPTQVVTKLENPFCTVAISEDFAKPNPFFESNRLKRTNELAIRFGGSSDMLTLFEGSSSEQNDYLWGLVYSSLIVAIFFLLWSIVICIFRCSGSRRVGFLCGRFVRPKEPTNPNEKMNQAEDHEELSLKEGEEPKEEEVVVDADDDNNEMSKEQQESALEEPIKVEIEEKEEETDALMVDDQKAYNDWQAFCMKQDRRLKRTRITVVISAMFIIVACMLFCVYGNKYLNRSFSSMRDGIGQIQETVGYSVELIDRLAIREAETASANTQALQEANGLCPNVRAQLCENIGGESISCNVEGIPFLSENLDNVIELVYEVKGYLFDELNDMRNDLQELYNDIDDFQDGQTSLEWAFWVSFAFALTVGVLSCVILWSIHLAHNGTGGKLFRFYRRHLFFPSFVFCVALAYAFACAFIIAAIGASDFCIGSPDRKVDWLLDESSDSLGTLVYSLGKYYVNTCSSSLRPGTIIDKITSVANILGAIGELGVKSETLDSEEWQRVCGSDLSTIQAFTGVMGRTSCLLSETLEDVNRLSWCRNWNPIYTKFAHEAVCYDAQEGLAWVASSMFCILVFGFVVLLLRAAVFDIEDEEEFAVGVRQFRRCCNRFLCRKSKDVDENDKDDVQQKVAGSEHSFHSVQDVQMT